MGKSKYKRVTDLYVQGAEAELGEGVIVWMQALNPYERDEAVHDAQVARSRMVMALRDSGDERTKCEARLTEIGPDALAKEMAAASSQDKVAQLAQEIRHDPEWKERIEIVTRTDPDNAAAPLTEEEKVLVDKINGEYVEEIIKREEAEREYLERSYGRMDRDELLDKYLEMYLDRRGSDIANQEYVLTEMWYAARECDATWDDGKWNHAACDHSVRVWDSKSEVRMLPAPITEILRSAMTRLEMQVAEAKNSARQGSSSDSSPLPSEPAESTPSTQGATPASAPGTSPQPSPTH